MSSFCLALLSPLCAVGRCGGFVAEQGRGAVYEKLIRFN